MSQPPISYRPRHKAQESAPVENIELFLDALEQAGDIPLKDLLPRESFKIYDQYQNSILTRYKQQYPNEFNDIQPNDLAHPVDEEDSDRIRQIIRVINKNFLLDYHQIFYDAARLFYDYYPQHYTGYYGEHFIHRPRPEWGLGSNQFLWGSKGIF